MSAIDEQAIERLAELEATTNYNVDKVNSPNAWVDGYTQGYLAGHLAANIEHATSSEWRTS